VKQKAISPGDADGDYSLLESDEGSIIPITVSGNNVIHPEGTSPITYNYPWDGFVVGADNTLELVLPGGIFFGGGAEGGDCWIFAGIKTGGEGASSAAINTAGGNGGRDEGTGGEGGEVTIQKFGGTGLVEVLVSGTVDASFTPTAPDPILGDYPVHITADTIIALEPDPPSAGEPYMLSFDPNLYICQGTGHPEDDVVATGLSVDAGATLTLPLNSDDTAELHFSDDVANNGTITTLDAGPLQRGGLVLEFNNYYGASGSAIDTSGTQPGQSGGDISLHSAGLEPNSGFYNQGAINAAGADNPGGEGGYGGSVELGGWEAFENSGPITTAGGTGDAGDGGEGGNVQIRSGVNYLYNGGAIDSTGGNGTGSGGQGGPVSMVSAEVGDTGGELRNSGDVSSTGGDGAGGPGGPGGNIELVALSADLFNNADFNSAGGDTSHAMSQGGDGGSITVAAAPGSLAAGPSGNLLLAGNIDSSGGNALAMGSGDGGSGGPVLVFLDASGSFTFVTGLPAPTTQRLALLGYANINTSGGNGNYGGDGGSVNLTDSGEEYEGEGWVDAPGGDVTNQAAITTCGGSVAAGAITTDVWGGSGGEVHLYGDQDGTLDPGTERVTNSGNIDTSGGDSLALTEVPDPNAGAIEMVSTNDVTNTGALTANGGSDTVDDDNIDTGFGHGGPMFIALVSISIDGTTTNNGAINANGGYGETQGGDASDTTVYLGDAVQVVNSGNISVRGGDADTGLPDSVGGDGGNIEMEDADTPDNTGTLDVSGGAGDWPGADGTIFP
jgi:hypothetical protein